MAIFRSCEHVDVQLIIKIKYNASNLNLYSLNNYVPPNIIYYVYSRAGGMFGIPVTTIRYLKNTDIWYFKIPVGIP